MKKTIATVISALYMCLHSLYIIHVRSEANSLQHSPCSMEHMYLRCLLRDVYSAGFFSKFFTHHCSFIHSFILNIYIAPLQENYSEAQTTQKCSVPLSD